MHYKMHYCAGYQKFLTDKNKFGKSYRWNWSFFFTSIIWLINNKMYREFFVLSFIYLNLTSFFSSFYKFNPEIAMPTISGIYMVMHILLTLFSHNFYFNHLENKFHKAKYDDTRCEKIAKPYPFIGVLVLFFIVSLMTIFSFNILHNLLIYLKNLIS